MCEKETDLSCGGFRFTFAGSSAEAVPLSAEKPFSALAESGTKIFLPQLPTYTLTPQLLEEWASQYPKSPQEKMELPGDAGAHVPPLLYQCAPHVAKLTVWKNQEQRDIIPGRYYGGLKVWSCAPFLVEYMFANHDNFTRLFKGIENVSCNVDAMQPHGNSSSNLLVAEVGCGQALPGIAALLLGASHVIFQDYNEEVLQLCVKPNVAVNLLRHIKNSGSCGDHPVSSFSVVQLVSGDWSRLEWQEPSDEMRKLRCKVVLGSDVTFDAEACEKLAGMLRRCLSPVGGVGYIASKQYYFGTNGGALEFQRCCKEYGLEVSEVSRRDATGGMQQLIMCVKHRI